MCRFQVLGPADPVFAVAGEDVVLPCYLKPNISAEDLEVRWFREDFLAPVHLYVDRKNNFEKQSKPYWGRTAVFKEELKTGNISLKLLKVRGSDDGPYKCYVQMKDPQYDDDHSIQLSVEAVGTEPVISMEGYREGGIGLLCESKGWHPEPELIWLDSEGHSLPAGSTETLRDSMDLFTVRRSVVVQEGDTNRFTCRVLQQQINQEKETEFHIPAEMFHRAHAWRVAFSVLLPLTALTLIGLAVLIHRQVKLLRKRGLLSRQLMDVTLDPDTAHPNLILSEDGKEVRHGDIRQKLPDTPKRFDPVVSVLGKEGFSSGRFYYEVQVGEKTEWTVGVAKESINRKGKITLSPGNGYWTIWLRNGTEYRALAGPDLPLPLREKPRTVGVYVDYEGGQVSFYNVEARSHIYSYYTGYTFTEDLYPYFSPSLSKNGTNSAPLIISPVKHIG
ncbi:butyrophilin subfamily 1 member A1-like [Megalops cyprinoides]|uniref:butyrophilin subfamily 1 member A1-like n=1 Tax=Megalops cyprinoides TaxID=118141 RepID=UPI0018654E15|nr:butyrophilin subfamily 1 member A1-like [Megalops cyprinoides]